jgi:hypothetical protein
MRITRNKEPGKVCALCGQPLVVGAPGANYLPSYTTVHRGHPACVNAWRTRQKLAGRGR